MAELTTGLDIKQSIEDIRAQLAEGITHWNQWRDRHPHTVCQFDHQDLSEGFFFEGNFSGVSFQHTTLVRACLIGANFRNANLQGADLSGAYLSEAKFCGADLRKADLTGANLNNADLSGARLEGVKLDGAVTYKAVFPKSSGLKAQLTSQVVRPRSNKTNQQKVRQSTVAQTRTSAVGLATPPAESQAVSPSAPLSRSSDFEPRSKFWDLTLRPFVWLIIAIGVVPAQLGLAGLMIANSFDSDFVAAIPERSSAAQTSGQKSAEQTAEQASFSLARSFDSTNQVWALAAHDSVGGVPIVAAGNADYQIQVWNQKTGKLMRVLADHRDTIRALAVSKTGQYLVSAGGDGLRVWNPKTSELLYSIPAAGLPVWSVAISPDEQFVISGDYDGRIEVRYLDSGELYYSLETGSTVWALAAAADGQSFVSGGGDRTIHHWNLPDGIQLQTLQGHSDAVRAIAISPDSQTLASGSWDNTIKLWDLNSGKVKSTITDHQDRVVSVAISPDGQTLASGSKDNTLKLWDISEDKAALTGDKTDSTKEVPLLKTLDRSDDWILSVVFSESSGAGDVPSSSLISGGKQQIVKVWQ